MIELVDSMLSIKKLDFWFRNRMTNYYLSEHFPICLVNEIELYCDEICQLCNRCNNIFPITFTLMTSVKVLCDHNLVWKDNHMQDVWIYLSNIYFEVLQRPPYTGFLENEYFYLKIEHKELKFGIGNFNAFRIYKKP